MARVGSIRHGKLKPAHDPAKFGNGDLVDFPQCFERQASEVQVCSAIGPILKAIRIVRRERFQPVVLQNIVLSGHSRHGLIISGTGLESLIS